MDNKYSQLLKNMSILTICNFSSKILVFFMVPLYTSVLSTEEYGLYDLAINTAMMLYGVLTLNISDGVLRYLLDETNDPAEVVSVGVKWLGISIAAMALLLSANHLLGLWQAIIGLEVLILLFFSAYTINHMSIQAAKGFDNIKAMGIAGVIGTLATIMFNILFLCVVKIGLQGFFIANILGEIIPALYLLYKVQIWKYIRFIKVGQLQREMLSFSMPLIFTSLGWSLTSAMGKYMVAFFAGVAANGLFSIAYKIPSILSVFQTIFTQAWQVSAVKAYNHPDREGFYKNVFFAINSIICILCAGLIVFIKPIASILFSANFYEAWQYTPLLLVGSVINLASGFAGPLLSAQKNSKAMACAAIMGLTVNLVLNLILTPAMGVQGAGIAALSSNLAIWFTRRNACKDLLPSKSLWKTYCLWLLLIAAALAEINERNAVVLGITLAILLLSAGSVPGIRALLKNNQG